MTPFLKEEIYARDALLANRPLPGTVAFYVPLSGFSEDAVFTKVYAIEVA
jgi:hypothetical protein